MSALIFSKGSWILMTGVTGLIGSAIADQVLKAGYKVRAVIRNPEKGKIVTELFHGKYGSEAFSTVMISNMKVEGAFDEAMKDCVSVIHVISDNSFSTDPKDVVIPTLEITNSLLNTAAETSSVKRFVFTSSQIVLPLTSEIGEINSTSWHPDADGIISLVWTEPYTEDRAPVVYMASKICTERECWEFMEKEKPGFALNVVVLGLLDNHPFAVGFVKFMGVSNFIDLVDNALIHLGALAMEGVEGQRLLAISDAFDFNVMVNLLDRLVPGNNLPFSIESTAKPRELKILKALGKEGFTGLEESVRKCLTSAGNKPTRG
ncbi:hypothetical protein BX600DRAFT_482182 [Xylariales sp. PMI_506]|nr:hypothetical protein BX600DRAFT_482182 [Xylariales sp. PMI_506]